MEPTLGQVASSLTPLQSLSAPSQISVAPGNTNRRVSSQSSRGNPPAQGVVGDAWPSPSRSSSGSIPPPLEQLLSKPSQISTTAGLCAALASLQSTVIPLGGRSVVKTGHRHALVIAAPTAA